MGEKRKTGTASAEDSRLYSWTRGQVEFNACTTTKAILFASHGRSPVPDISRYCQTLDQRARREERNG